MEQQVRERRVDPSFALATSIFGLGEQFGLTYNYGVSH